MQTSTLNLNANDLTAAMAFVNQAMSSDIRQLTKFLALKSKGFKVCNHFLTTLKLKNVVVGDNTISAGNIVIDIESDSIKLQRNLVIKQEDFIMISNTHEVSLFHKDLCIAKVSYVLKDNGKYMFTKKSNLISNLLERKFKDGNPFLVN